MEQCLGPSCITPGSQHAAQMDNHPSAERTKVCSHLVIQPHHLLHRSCNTVAWRDAWRKTVAGGKDGALQLSEL